jgi:hypothetical protein
MTDLSNKPLMHTGAGAVQDFFQSFLGQTFFAATHTAQGAPNPSPAPAPVFTAMSGAALKAEPTPREAANQATELLKQGKPVPEALLSKVAEEEWASAYLGSAYVERGKPVPEVLINKATQNTNASAYLGRAYVEKGLPVPDVLFYKSAMDVDASASLGLAYVYKNQPVPDVLFCKSAMGVYASSSLGRAYLVMGQPVPEMLFNKASENAGASAYLASAYMEKNQPVPKALFNKAAENAGASANLGRAYLENRKPVPDVLVNKAAEDGAATFVLIKAYFNKGVSIPPILSQDVLADSGLSGHVVAGYVAKGKQPPEDMIKMAAKDPAVASSLRALYAREKQPIPDVLAKVPAYKPAGKLYASELNETHTKQTHSAKPSYPDDNKNIDCFEFTAWVYKQLTGRSYQIDNQLDMNVRLPFSDVKALLSKMFNDKFANEENFNFLQREIDKDGSIDPYALHELFHTLEKRFEEFGPISEMPGYHHTPLATIRAISKPNMFVDDTKVGSGKEVHKFLYTPSDVTTPEMMIKNIKENTDGLFEGKSDVKIIEYILQNVSFDASLSLEQTAEYRAYLTRALRAYQEGAPNLPPMAKLSGVRIYVK